MLCLTQSTAMDGALPDVLDKTICMLEIAPDGVIINANVNYAALSGYAHEDIVGRNYRQLCTTDFVASDAYGDFWSRLRKGETITGVFQRQRKNGTVFWLDAVYGPVYDESGKIKCVVLFAMDVTDRVERTREVEGRLDAIDRAMLMAEYSPEGGIISANENFLSAFGYNERKLAGKNIEHLFSEKHLGDGTFLKIWDYSRNGHTCAELVEMCNADGAPVYLESIFAPIFDARGKLEKVAHFSSDVSWRMTKDLARRASAEIHSHVFNQTGSAILVSDKNNRVVLMNPAFFDMFGYHDDDIIGRPPACVFGPKEKKVLSEFRAMLETGGTLRLEEVAYGRDGQRYWTSLVANPIFDAAGTHTCTVCVFTDITSTKMHEVLQREMLNALTHEVALAEVLKLILLEVERITPELLVSVMRLHGNGMLAPLAAPSLPKGCLDRILELALKDQVGISVQALRSGATKVYKELDTLPDYSEAGDWFRELGIHASSSTPIRAPDDTALGVVTFYYLQGRNPDAFHLGLAQVLARLCATAFAHEEARTAARRLSFYDPVTSLPNRNLLIVRAEQLLRSRLHRGQTEPVAVLWVNMDRFRRINDSLGFDSGNLLLDTVGKRLASKLGAGDIIGRVGADEFVVVSPDCDDARAADLARRLQKSVSEPYLLGNTEVLPSVSVGISFYPDNGSDIETLLNNANIAMTLARKNRTHGFSFFDQQQNHQARANFTLESDLRRAIRDGGLHLRFQPQVYFDSGRLHGAEALSRWAHPELGDIPPSRFIPLAEETGLIGELSEWVVQESCRRMRIWRDRSIPVADISVNLSAANFHDVHLPGRIAEYLRGVGLRPSDFVLELTESVLLDEDPSTMETIHKAHELGFSLSLDDFGTGYSSLGYLRRLPISAIKLDQMFVRDIHSNETSRKLSQAIVHLGQSLDLTVVVEGVETGEQYELLKNQGYRILQGYYVSRPLTAEEFENWVMEGMGVPGWAESHGL